MRICSTDSNGDTDLYTANFSLEARGLVDNLLMEDTFKTTVSEALEKTADNGNLEAYFPAWTRKLFCWNPPSDTPFVSRPLKAKSPRGNDHPPYHKNSAPFQPQGLKSDNDLSSMQ